jgi:hypothetical protein
VRACVEILDVPGTVLRVGYDRHMAGMITRIAKPHFETAMHPIYFDRLAREWHELQHVSSWSSKQKPNLAIQFRMRSVSTCSGTVGQHRLSFRDRRQTGFDTVYYFCRVFKPRQDVTLKHIDVTQKTVCLYERANCISVGTG